MSKMSRIAQLSMKNIDSYCCTHSIYGISLLLSTSQPTNITTKVQGDTLVLMHSLKMINFHINSSNIPPHMVFYITAYTIRPGILLILIFLFTTQLCNELLEQGYVKERLKSSEKKFNRRYGYRFEQDEVSLSRILNDSLKFDILQWQLLTMGISNQTMTLLPNLTFYRIARGFRRVFSTGVAC